MSTGANRVWLRKMRNAPAIMVTMLTSCVRESFSAMLVRLFCAGEGSKPGIREPFCAR